MTSLFIISLSSSRDESLFKSLPVSETHWVDSVGIWGMESRRLRLHGSFIHKRTNDHKAVIIRSDVNLPVPIQALPRSGTERFVARKRTRATPDY
jgi:hypothetical protein